MGSIATTLLVAAIASVTPARSPPPAFAAVPAAAALRPQPGCPRTGTQRVGTGRGDTLLGSALGTADCEYVTRRKSPRPR